MAGVWKVPACHTNNRTLSECSLFCYAQKQMRTARVNAGKWCFLNSHSPQVKAFFFSSKCFYFLSCYCRFLTLRPVLVWWSNCKQYFNVNERAQSHASSLLVIRFLFWSALTYLRANFLLHWLLMRYFNLWSTGMSFEVLYLSTVLLFTFSVRPRRHFSLFLELFSLFVANYSCNSMYCF